MTNQKAMKLAIELLKSAHVSSDLVWERHDCVQALEEALAKQEQGEPQPTLYVKDIDGNYHLYKEKGHTENCAALGDDCCPENHLPPSRVGVGDSDSTSKQEQGEPVAWLCEPDKNGLYGLPLTDKGCTKCFPVYTKPQQRKPLTDEQISDLWCKTSNTDFVTADTHEFARAIEAAHGIKE